MKASAELQIIPVGEGVSLRKQVTRIIDLLKNTGLGFESHAFGTDIEGDLDDILETIGKVHKTLHEEGSVRLISNLKLETRTDKIPTLAGKRLSDWR